MKALFTETKHKLLSTFIVTVASFLGFEALSYIIGIYQLKQSLYAAFYIYAFHIFWLTFVFDLHLKKRGILSVLRLSLRGISLFWQAFKQRVEHAWQWKYLGHYQNYLVLPGLLYWSTVVLMFLNPFRYGFKQILIFASTVALSVVYWHMKEHINRNLESHNRWLRILSLVKLYCAFLVYSSVFAVTLNFAFDKSFLFLSSLTLTFLLIYQVLFQHDLLTFNVFLALIGISIIQAVLAVLIFNVWNTEYFTAGLLMLAVYNSLWGILHHHVEKTLSRKLVFEYLAMMILVASFLLASHNFNQRIV